MQNSFFTRLGVAIEGFVLVLCRFNMEYLIFSSYYLSPLPLNIFNILLCGTDFVACFVGPKSAICGPQKYFSAGFDAGLPLFGL